MYRFFFLFDTQPKNSGTSDTVIGVHGVLGRLVAVVDAARRLFRVRCFELFPLLNLQQLLPCLGDNEEGDEASNDEASTHHPELPVHGQDDEGGDLKDI